MQCQAFDWRVGMDAKETVQMDMPSRRKVIEFPDVTFGVSYEEGRQRNKARRLRLAMSGTYSTGKTTTSYALSYLTGIERTHAKTMREILPIALPGKTLEECTPPQLVQLGIRRFVERAVHESHLPDGFISDGSSLHEWVYGAARMESGISPGQDGWAAFVKSFVMLPSLPILRAVISNFGDVVKQHAKTSYEYFIHLPVEFPLVSDGHRPVSERFRQLSDSMLLETLETLHIPYIVIGGTLEERLARIVDELGLYPVCEIEHAAAQARDAVERLNNMLPQEGSSPLLESEDGPKTKQTTRQKGMEP